MGLLAVAIIIILVCLVVGVFTFYDIKSFFTGFLAGGKTEGSIVFSYRGSYQDMSFHAEGDLMIKADTVAIKTNIGSVESNTSVSIKGYKGLVVMKPGDVVLKGDFEGISSESAKLSVKGSIDSSVRFSEISADAYIERFEFPAYGVLTTTKETEINDSLLIENFHGSLYASRGMAAINGSAAGVATVRPVS